MTPGAYRLALDGIMRGLLRVLLPLLRLMLRSGIEDDSIRAMRIDRLAPVVLINMRRTRRLVGELTARFMRAQALQHAGVRDPYIPPMSGYSLKGVKTTLENIAKTYVDGGLSRDQALDNAGSIFVRHAEQVGRDMIADAVEPDDAGTDASAEEVARGDSSYPVMRPVDRTIPEKPADPVPEVEAPVKDQAGDVRRPVAWARMLTGADDCAFCVMLASRGPVYGSRQRALFANGNPLEKYHDNCDCIAVPVYTSKSWPGKAEAEALMDLWVSATKGFTQGDAINALRRELYRKKQAGEELIPGRVPLREVA